MGRIKKKLLLGGALAMLCTGVFAASPQQSFAAPVSPGSACVAGTEESPACQAQTSNPISGSGSVLEKVTHLLAIITGMATVIMFIIGGLMYVLSNGDSSRINLAKNTLIYASIGVIITIVAQSIVVFVLNKT